MSSKQKLYTTFNKNRECKRRLKQKLKFLKKVFLQIPLLKDIGENIRV